MIKKKTLAICAITAALLVGACAIFAWRMAQQLAAPAASVRAVQAPAPAPSHPLAPPEEIDWFALVPRDWEPIKTFMSDMQALSDSDPRAMSVLDKLRAAWADAPAEPSMEGARVSIGGYAIPLDNDGGGAVSEMLLVPYFGACIHAPPPPANQIIHVFLNPAAKSIKMMDPVRIGGTLHLARVRKPASAEGLADAIGYDMVAESVVPYEVNGKP